VIPAEGVQVPGGILTIDMLRGGTRLWYWLRTINASLASYTQSTEAVSRDIVVLDPTRRQVLYREGPYDGSTVENAFRKALDQVSDLGLDTFLRERMAEQVRDGSRSALGRTRPLVLAERTLQYNFWRIRSLFRRR
jgi:hypothetical protein